MACEPPFTLTAEMLGHAAAIAELVGRISVEHGQSLSVHLRRENRIRTIHSSLAIEHNTLTLEQVTAVLDGKRVLGNPNEIREVTNAYDAYELMLEADPLSVHDLLECHGRMMAGLVREAGRFRSGGVGIFDNDKVVHVAPPADLVPQEIRDLMAWYGASTLHPLVKAAVFHYEFEFIHPFADGNGRMGRMWHSMLLGAWNELFFWLPVEELIQARQQDYYDALGRADSEGESTCFVEFMLGLFEDALERLDAGTPQDTQQVDPQDTPQVAPQVTQQVAALLAALGEKELGARELMAALGLADRKNFVKNYLNPALERGLVERTIPDKPRSRNQRYRRARER